MFLLRPFGLPSLRSFHATQRLAMSRFAMTILLLLFD
jgi:hypothetical protein